MIGMGLLGFQKAYILCAQLDSGRRSWHVVATYAGPGDPLLCCVRGTSYQADPHPQRRPPTLALCHCHTSSASCAFQRRGIGHARRAQSNGSDNSAQRRFNGLCVMRAGNGRRRKNIYHRARALPVPAAWRRPCGKRVAITPWGRGDRTGPGVRHAGSLLKCRGERGERRPGTVARRRCCVDAGWTAAWACDVAVEWLTIPSSRQARLSLRPPPRRTRSPHVRPTCSVSATPARTTTTPQATGVNALRGTHGPRRFRSNRLAPYEASGAPGLPEAGH
jgi:hypothetical protein